MDGQLGADPAYDPPTHFAPAARAGLDEVLRVAAEVRESPVLSTLLVAFGGIVAVLNRHRQILAVNQGLLGFLGLSEAMDALGLRPGEVLKCVHREDWPGGCGTSRFCSTCGAAIAIVLAQRESTPQERECLLTVRGAGEERSLELRVRAVPLTVGDQPLVLLLLQDIREEKRREAMERVFLHDLNNVLASLSGYASVFSYASEEEYPELAARVEALSYILADEIRSHSIILDAEQGRYQPRPAPVELREVLQYMEDVFKHQSCAQGRVLKVGSPAAAPTLMTDQPLLNRILVNMVKNALEATPPGGEVTLTVEEEGSALVFRVHNPGAMPEQVSMRVFQRHFSTKDEPGRGLGTYSMKLLGERCLGGKVTFVTSMEGGTTFCLFLPRTSPDQPVLAPDLSG